MILWYFFNVRNALVDIFDMVDLDSNGTLSRDEFNMFQLRTSGEGIDDDAWEVVEENFELKKGELTRKGKNLFYYSLFKAGAVPQV